MVVLVLSSATSRTVRRDAHEPNFKPRLAQAFPPQLSNIKPQKICLLYQGKVDFKAHFMNLGALLDYLDCDSLCDSSLVADTIRETAVSAAAVHETAEETKCSNLSKADESELSAVVQTSSGCVGQRCETRSRVLSFTFTYPAFSKFNQWFNCGRRANFQGQF